MKTILEEVGFTAKRYLAYDTEGEVFGRPDQVELDVVIQDGQVIVLEIKSSLDRGHVHLFARKVAFYTRKTGQQVARQVIVTPYPEWGRGSLPMLWGWKFVPMPQRSDNPCPARSPSMQCPQCQQDNSPQAKFCLECGSRLVLTGAQCGTELPPDAKFCLECGQ